MALGITVCIGDPFPHSSKNITPPPLFLASPPPPPQDLDFSVNPQNIKDFFVLHPTLSYLLKVIKFLVKISQFEFLVMTEQSIVVYKLYKCFKQKGGGGAHYGYGLKTLRKCSKRVETKKN